MSKEKVLVTGASGFLGKEVINLLKKEKIPFIALSRHKAKGIKQVDLTKNIIIEENFDIVIHLAGLNHTKNLKDYYLVNAEGTENLLQFCVKNKIKKFIFTSSCSVYGEKIPIKLNEKTRGKNLSDYAKSKLIAETKIIKYSKKFGFEFVILRFPTLIGEKSSENRVKKIITEYKKHKTLRFAKDSTLMITDVKDAAKIILKAIKNGEGIYNAIEYTPKISQIIDTLNKKNSKRKVTFLKSNNKKIKIDSKRFDKHLAIEKKLLDEIIK